MTTPITCNVPAPIYRIVSVSSNILELEFTNPLDMIGGDCPVEIHISFNTLVGGSRIDWKFLAFVTSRIQLVGIALPPTYGTISVRYYNCCDAFPDPSVSPSPSPSVSPSPSPSVSPSPLPCAPGCNSANYDVLGTPELRVLYNVGTTGGPSAYCTYDQAGNGAEWCSLDAIGATTIVRRGGSWAVGDPGISQHHRADQAPNFVAEIVGFRLASSQASSSFARVDNFVNINDTRVSQGGGYYGSVDHLYYIGKYEITTAEYCAFLTAVGNLTYGVGTVRDDVFSLYNAFDSGGTVANNGISRSGASGAYIYAPKSNYSLRPVTFVSWLNCARYVNWLHNGGGSGSSAGDTETGVYSLNGVAVPTIVPNKASDAIFWIPTENEWYKAAYYKGGSTNAGYWRYSTQSDNVPTEVVAMLTNGSGVVPEDCVGTPYPSPSVSPSVSPSPSPSVSPNPPPTPAPCICLVPCGECDSDVPCPSGPPLCLDVLLSFTDVYKEKPQDILNLAPLNPIWVPKEFKITVSQTNCDAIARIESNPCRIPDRGNNCRASFEPVIDILTLPILANSACYSCSRPIEADSPCRPILYVPPTPPIAGERRNVVMPPRFYAPDYTIFKLLWLNRGEGGVHPSIDCHVYGVDNMPRNTWILVHTTSTDSEMREWICEHFRFHCMIDGIPSGGWPYNDLYWTAWDEVSPTLEQNTVYINLIPC